MKVSLPAVARRSLLSLAAAVAAAGMPRRSSADARRDETGAWLPLTVLDESSILIDISLVGRRRTALLDTGASATVLDAPLAAELKLEPVSRRVLRGYSDVGGFDELPAFTATVGGVDVAFSRAVRTDLTTISSSMGRKIDIIVGHDLFEGRLVELDMPAERWRVHPRSGPAKVSGTALDLKIGPHREPLITVGIEGRPPTPAIIDLGASAALTLSRAYADAHDLVRDKRTSSAAFAGVNGVTLSTSVMMDSLRLAGADLRALPSEIPAQWLTPEIPAIVGLSVLRRFRITFDFQGGKVWLAPSPVELRKPFREDHAGLGVAFAGDRLIVRHVAARSPAAEGGWKEGEEIVAIDGRSVAQVYADAQLRGWREGPPGSVVTLGLAGGSRRTLVLRDYY